MKTLTLKIKDDYFDKFIAFLDMLPKKAVTIEDTSEKEKLALLQKNIKKAMHDIESGNTKTIKVIS